jgi:O-antigen ligase
VLGGLLALGGAAGVGLGAVHRPALAIGAVLALAVGLLVAADLAALPFVLALTMFVEGVSVAGIPVGRLAGVMALAAFGVHALTRGTLGIRPNALLAVVAGLGVWTLASSFWAQDGGLVSTTALSYVLAVSYLLAFAALVRTRRQVVGVLTVIVVGSIVFGLLAFLAYAAGLEVGGAQEGRTQGFSGDPNYFAIYQVAALPAALVLAARETRPGRRLALAAGVVVIVLSVVSTLSRTGLVALALVVLVTLLAPSRLFFRHAGQKALYALTLALSAGVAALAGSSELVARVQTILEPGADRGAGRTDLYRAAVTGWHEHPWLGLGAGNFQAESLSLLQRTPGVNTEASYASAGRVVHNAYLELLVELGPVGLALLVLLLVLAARYLLLAARRARAAAEPTLERASYAVLLSLLAFSVSAFFLSNQLGKLLWVTVGLALALDTMARSLSPVSVGPGPVGQPAPPDYDLAVRERLVEQRERRLAGDFDAIREERARLAEQKALLDAQQRDLVERIAAVTERELAVAQAEAAARRGEPLEP